MVERCSSPFCFNSQTAWLFTCTSNLECTLPLDCCCIKPMAFAWSDKVNVKSAPLVTATLVSASQPFSAALASLSLPFNANFAFSATNSPLLNQLATLFPAKVTAKLLSFLASATINEASSDVVVIFVLFKRTSWSLLGSFLDTLSLIKKALTLVA